jgi:inner membrane protein
MNPLCWNLLLLETQGDRYIVRRGVVSDAPGLIPAARCSVIDSGRLMGSSFGKSAAPQAPDLYWLGELAMSKAWLAKVVTEHCDAAALMLFARVPFAEALENRLVMSDLRFDQGRGNGMSSLSLGAPTTEPCLPPVPWTQPRLDLLP